MPISRLNRLLLTACLTLFGISSARAADAPPAAPKKPADNAFFALDPADAGPDYKIQGEYEGKTGDAKLGAQVIAGGNGTFKVVFEPGGLPGDGSDGKTRIEVDGKTDGDKTVVGGEGKFSGEIADGKLTGKTDKGDAFELTRVDRHSPTEDAKPPEGAIVLFDGTNADAWTNGKMNDKHWLYCGTKSKQKFSDYTLHVEFYLPFKPFARGQGRANSGVYQQDRYEVQVLDSFGLKGLNNECGAIYSHTAPLVNTCFPPLTWQTYDIDFTAARYGPDGKKVSNARITEKFNGVLVLDNVEIVGPTGGGQKEIPADAVQSGVFQLQPHGNPVFFKNIWVVEKK